MYRERSLPQVTSGKVQGLLIKKDTCPTAIDIAPTGASCSDRCFLSWTVRYDSFTGASTHAPNATVSSGFELLGSDPPPADWCVAVQALREVEGEFDLHITSRPRPKEVVAFDCGRFSHFCPTGQTSVFNSSISLLGAGVPSAASPRLYAHGHAVLALLVALSVLHVRRK